MFKRYHSYWIERIFTFWGLNPLFQNTFVNRILCNCVILRFTKLLNKMIELYWIQVLLFPLIMGIFVMKAWHNSTVRYDSTWQCYNILVFQYELELSLTVLSIRPIHSLSEVYMDIKEFRNWGITLEPFGWASQTVCYVHLHKIGFHVVQFVSFRLPANFKTNCMTRHLQTPVYSL